MDSTNLSLTQTTTIRNLIMNTSMRPRIAIIGAGISGLSLSHALDVFAGEGGGNVQLDIYEASSSLSEIGAGINIWPRTWNILKMLGMEDQLLKYLPHRPDDLPRLVFEICKADQLEGFHILNMTTQGGTIRLHRRMLQKELLTCQPEGRIHLSHRLSSYEETESEVHLHFANGSSATCDMLIGADGIRSTVRRSFLGHQLRPNTLDIPSLNGVAGWEDPVWQGTYAYRGLVPIEKLEELFPNHRAITTPLMYVGKLKHIICYPLPHERAINIVAMGSDLAKEGQAHPGPQTSYCDKEEVLSLFSGWDAEVQALLECMDRPSKWALMALVPLERYSRGRVVLVGDAAHGMTPHQGAGAGQAIEDVYILANLLSRKSSTKNDVLRISEIYNAVRCPTGNRVLRLAREAGHISELVAPGFEDVIEGATDVPLEKLRTLFEGMIGQWEWVWDASEAEEDKHRAMNMLDE